MVASTSIEGSNGDTGYEGARVSAAPFNGPCFCHASDVSFSGASNDFYAPGYCSSSSDLVEVFNYNGTHNDNSGFYCWFDYINTSQTRGIKSAYCTCVTLGATITASQPGQVYAYDATTTIAIDTGGSGSTRTIGTDSPQSLIYSDQSLFAAFVGTSTIMPITDASAAANRGMTSFRTPSQTSLSLQGSTRLSASSRPTSIALGATAATQSVALSGAVATSVLAANSTRTSEGTKKFFKFASPLTAAALILFMASLP